MISHILASAPQGRAALAAGRAEDAVQLCQAAMESPENLGEAKHLLANDSDVRHALGCALAAAGRQVGEVWGQGGAVGCRVGRQGKPAALASALAHGLQLLQASGRGQFLSASTTACSSPHCVPYMPGNTLQEEAEEQWRAAAEFEGDFQVHFGAQLVCELLQAALLCHA